MRCFYQSNYRDSEGNIISSGQVNVFLAGTSTAASIYTTLAGAVAVNSVATDVYGYFSFYVDRLDYNYNQLFKLQATKTGYETITRDSIDVTAICLGTYNITANKVVGTNLVIPQGVVYNVSPGVSLTFTGNISAGDYQIFTGTGTVIFGSDVLSEYNSLWFAAGLTVTVTTPVNSKKIFAIPIRVMLRATDPDTSGWGLNDTQLWATLEGTKYMVKYWNGEEVVLLG